MAVLTKRQRKRLPNSAFAGPDRTFPIDNKDHAEAALMDVTIALHKGSVTPTEAHRIRIKARRALRQDER